MTTHPRFNCALWTTALAVPVLVWLALHCAGCAGALEQSRAGAAAPGSDVAYCRRLDAAHATWGAIGKGTVLLSSGAGLSTLPVDPDSKTLRLSLAASSLGFAALSVVALYASDSAAESWARDCIAKPPPPAVARASFADSDCLGLLLARFADGSSCPETQLAVDASDRCRADYPGGVRLDCSEFGGR